jgi:hypothetical protein
MSETTDLRQISAEEAAEEILSEASVVYAWTAYQEAAYRENGGQDEKAGIEAALRSVVPLVADIISSARSEGAAAAKERVARQLEAEASTYGVGSPAAYYSERAARIARSTP